MIQLLIAGKLREKSDFKMKNATNIFDDFLVFNSTEEPMTYNCSQPTSNVDPNFTKYLASLQGDQLSLLLFLLLFSLATIFGNCLVISAVIRERCLQTSTNFFVMSLAIADCLVGLIVMPFSVLYEVLNNTWFFGTDWCDIWRSLDVFCSTASILNLCVISMDRYLAITDPISYPMKMTRNRAIGFIAAVWLCSSAISFPAILWWRTVRKEPMPPFKCNFTEDLGYLIFSSTISFYLPLLVMVFTYARIYHAASIQTRSLKLGTKQIMMPSGELQLTLRIHRGGTMYARQRPDYAIKKSSLISDDPNEDGTLPAQHDNEFINQHRNLGKKISISRKIAKFAKEKKAAKTLGIVMGVFIM